MKKLLKNFFVTIAMAVSLVVISAIVLPQTSAYAGFSGRAMSDSACNGSFLGLKAWDCGVTINNQGDLTNSSGVWKIAGNVAEDVLVIATYLIVGYVIYGGYLYIFSSGDPTKAASGKKTISHAFIGLAIVVFAKIILSSIGIALGVAGGSFAGKDCTKGDCVNTPAAMVTSLINWVIGVAGVVSAIYVVVGGVGYLTSAGDPSKLQKAKTTIVYSLIGLAIVGLSTIISNYGYGIIEAANSGNDIKQPILKLLNSVIGFLSIVSVIFVVKGGVGYMTSSGDPGKVKAAKDTILYACIGLVVCVLSFAIVNWAVGIINNSSTPQPQQGGGTSHDVETPETQ